MIVVLFMKKESVVLKKSLVGFELGMLVVSLFAFSYMIYSIDVVSGQIVSADYFENLVRPARPISLSTPSADIPNIEKVIVPKSTGTEKFGSHLSEVFGYRGGGIRTVGNQEAKSI